MVNSERKDVFFGILTPYLINHGYRKYLTGEDPSFVKNIGNDIVIHFFFNFFSRGEIGVGPLRMTHYEVEDHILNNGIPINKLIQQKKKEKYHLPTVTFKNIPDILAEEPLQTKVEIEAFAHSYITYLENEGQAFIDKYSYLPNILKEMDRLEAEGLYWKEILSGGPDYLFRGVIISKLCNDPQYDQKLSFVDSLMQDLDEWQPYWEKLKAVLHTIEPKYSL